MVTVDLMSEQDIPGVVKFMGDYPELAFESWEDERLLRRTLKAQPGHSLVARGPDGFVGALIGGMFCGRATISHVGVLPAFRALGYGQRVVNQSLSGFRSKGATRCHILVTVDNAGGRNFWQNHMKFRPSDTLRTFECNLGDDWSEAFDAVERLSARNSSEVRAFLLAHAPHEVSHLDQLVSYSLMNGTAAGACFFTRLNDEVNGVAVIGTYGVRGVLHRVVHTAPKSPQARCLTKASLEWLRRHDVLRVHGFFNPAEDPMVECFTDLGFADQSVEMMELTL